MSTTDEIVSAGSGVVLISLRSKFQREVAELVVKNTIGFGLTVRHVDPATIVTSYRVLELLDPLPLMILLPLSLPNFMSLYIAEVVHERKLATRLILCSATNAPQELLGQLYDRILIPPIEASNLIPALRAPREKRLDRDEIRRVITSLLRTAHCFFQPNLLGAHEASSYSQYLAARDGDVREAIEEFLPADGRTHSLRILVIFANPRNSNPLRIASEERIIKECLRLSRYRHSFQIRTCPAANVKDVQRALLDEAVEVIHFSGHGTSEGLVFESDVGSAQVPPISAISALCSDFTPPLSCVIMNACFSRNQALAIAKMVPFVIYSLNSIGDDEAIEFSRGFYDALGAGKPIDFSFRQGCRALALLGYSDDRCPKLFRRPSGASSDTE